MRALAAAGLGTVGAGDDLEALRGQRRRRPRRRHRRGRGRRRDRARRSRGAAPDWRATLLERIADPRPAMRAAAISAAAAWLLDPVLERRSRRGSRRARRRSVAARSWRLARRARVRRRRSRGGGGRDPDAVVRAAAAAPRARSRPRAARASRRRRTRARCGSGLRGAGPSSTAGPRPDLYTRFLADPSTSVRAPCSTVSPPHRSFPSSRSSTRSPARSAPRPSSRSRGGRLERRAAVTPPSAGRSSRRSRGWPRSAPTRCGSRPSTLWSRSAARAPLSDRPLSRAARATTAAWRRGPASRAGCASRPAAARPSASTAPRAAPVDRLPQLAEQGFYDGSALSGRAGRSLEAGGPDGDGRGGPGFTLRDEPCPLRLRAGLVRPGPAGSHASGSRFLIQIADAPRSRAR